MKIQDSYGRVLDYVRISITDRCNFRCRYCMPEDGVVSLPHDRIMTYEDISFLIDVLQSIGVGRIRFTGGEPMVRRGFVTFLEEQVKLHGGMAFALTTNGANLSSVSDRIAKLDLDGVSVSIDSLRSDRFKYITRCGSLHKVIEGIESLAGRINSLKLNTVLIRGFNDDEMEKMVSFSRERDILLRFIEFMPLDNHVWREGSFLSVDDMIKRLPDRESWFLDGPDRSPQSGPAVYYRNCNTGQKVGFIAAVSHHFCESCNRLRITASGQMRTCLFSSDDIDLMRSIKARDGDGLAEVILSGAKSKPRRWMDIACGENHMSQIGG